MRPPKMSQAETESVISERVTKYLATYGNVGLTNEGAMHAARTWVETYECWKAEGKERAGEVADTFAESVVTKYLNHN